MKAKVADDIEVRQLASASKSGPIKCSVAVPHLTLTEWGLYGNRLKMNTVWKLKWIQTMGPSTRVAQHGSHNRVNFLLPPRWSFRFTIDETITKLYREKKWEKERERQWSKPRQWGYQKKKKRTNILKFVILNGCLAWDQQTLADGAPH